MNTLLEDLMSGDERKRVAALLEMLTGPNAQAVRLLLALALCDAIQKSQFPAQLREEAQRWAAAMAPTTH